MERLIRLKQQLSTKMTGQVSEPGQALYKNAVSIWARPKVLPQLVAHCANVADVQLAVQAAVDANIAISVRGGGHDWTGRALCDGLTLDMSALKSVGPISSGSIIEVGGGAKGTDIYSITDNAGLAPVLGSVADIGVTGLVTGGGYGPLLRRFGLACDNLIAATIVLADGRVVRAADGINANLFWAIRGGGGNFGVITSLELKLHNIPKVQSGVMVFPFSEARSILPRLRELWQISPQELDLQGGIIPGPDGELVLYLSPTWSGDPNKCDAALAPIYAVKNRIMVDVREQHFGASRKFFDSHIVKGRTTSADTVWIRDFNDEVSRIIVEAMLNRPSPLCFVLFHDFSGAAAQVCNATTAFGLRKPHTWFEIIAPADPSNGGSGSLELKWVEDVADSLAPYSYPGGYANLLGPTQSDRAKLGFGGNAIRLIQAKKEYDPSNLFKSAISIPA